MKIGRKGAWIVIVALLLIPLLADLAIAATADAGGPKKRLSLIIYKYYLIAIPIYVVYFIVAKFIIKAWDNWKNR